MQRLNVESLFTAMQSMVFFFQSKAYSFCFSHHHNYMSSFTSFSNKPFLWQPGSCSLALSYHHGNKSFFSQNILSPWQPMYIFSLGRIVPMATPYQTFSMFTNVLLLDNELFPCQPRYTYTTLLECLLCHCLFPISHKLHYSIHIASFLVPPARSKNRKEIPNKDNLKIDRKFLI